MNINENNLAAGGPGDGEAALSAYLWDGTGAPDAFTARLEATLRPLAFQPASAVVVRTRRLVRLAAAAVVLVGVTVVLVLMLSNRPSSLNTATWNIASIGRGVKLGQPQSIKKVYTVRTLETEPGASVVMGCGVGTTVLVEGGSAVKIIDADPQWPWLEVERGSVMVQVGLSDRPVGIETMDQRVDVKPGGAIMLTADLKAGGQVAVKSGECEVRQGNQTYRIPETYGCSVGGPLAGATPVRYDASAELKGALASLESMLNGKFSPKARDAAVYRVLERARPEDAATLWNLLPRLVPEERMAVAEWMGKTVGDPKSKMGIDLKAIAEGDKKEMEELWKLIEERRKGGQAK